MTWQDDISLIVMILFGLIMSRLRARKSENTGPRWCYPVRNITSVPGFTGTMRGSRKSYPYAGLASEKGEEGNGSGAWGDG
jgi:hypothetical protein